MPRKSLPSVMNSVGGLVGSRLNLSSGKQMVRGALGRGLKLKLGNQGGSWRRLFVVKISVMTVQFRE